MSQDSDLHTTLVLDALSNGLNISMAELLGILGRQAPISNLLLEPILGLQQLAATTTLLAVPSIHSQKKAALGPVAGETEEERKDLKRFLITYWIALCLACLIAVSAVWTKVHMAAHKGRKKFETKKKPQSDVEKWHLRRQREREASLQMGQVDDQAPGT